MVRPPYQAAVRLCVLTAERYPEICAEYYHPGYQLLRERPHQLLNLVYAWAIERVEHDKLDDWKAELLELLPWQDDDGDAGAELESASFFAMQGKGG